MAENTIEILIKAVDEMSATMKKIEKQLETSNKNIQKTNKQTSNSFKEIQGAMLNLGQIAQGIHNIFETQERVTIKLQNATDNLENSQIRLSQASENLYFAQKRLVEIEEAHERDSITLERAQLKLKDAQKELKKYTDRLAEGVIFLDSKQRKYEEALLNVKEAQLDVSDAQRLGTKKTEELATAAKILRDKQDAITIANNKVERSTRALEKATKDAKWAYVDMGIQAINVAGNMGTFFNTIKNTTAISNMLTDMGLLSSAIGIGGLGAIGGVAGALLGLVAVTESIKKPFEEANQLIEEQIIAYSNMKLSVDSASQAILDMMIMEEKHKRFKIGKYSPSLTSSWTPPPLPDYIQQASDSLGKPGLITSFDDFIYRPGKSPVSFSPDDTIIGAKDLSGFNNGMTIVINGDNYGVNANEIATQLINKLQRKILL